MPAIAARAFRVLCTSSGTFLIWIMADMCCTIITCGTTCQGQLSNGASGDAGGSEALPRAYIEANGGVIEPALEFAAGLEALRQAFAELAAALELSASQTSSDSHRNQTFTN